MRSIEPPLLDLSGITKRFGPVTANDNVDFQLRRGEIVGLLGENGAGKTTLMNIVFGLYRPDEGSIAIDGRAVDIRSTADAMSCGVGMVHQHAHVVGRHTVLENVIAGLPGRRGFQDRVTAIRRLEEIRASCGLHLPQERLAAELAVGEKQRLDIIRALFRMTRVLILDEPTSVLTPEESAGLFDAIRALAKNGMGVVLISHKLDDVRAITNRVVVMRRGKVAASVDNNGRLSNSHLATLMCGHEPEKVARRASRKGDPRLRLTGLVLSDQRRPNHRAPPFDLSILSGEIVGVAGVSGNGQVGLAETIAGIRAAMAGTISIEEKVINMSNPRSFSRSGIAYIPEDRIGAGFAGRLTLAENAVISRFRSRPFSRYGLLDRRAIMNFAIGLIEQYDIRPPSPTTRMTMFSGGNQQKAIVAREIAFPLRVLVIAQPTRGLDIAATSFVHRQLMGLKDQGCAIVMISDDLEELFQLSDRLAVICDGTIVMEGTTELMTVAEVGLAMSGAWKPGNAA